MVTEFLELKRILEKIQLNILTSQMNGGAWRGESDWFVATLTGIGITRTWTLSQRGAHPPNEKLTKVGPTRLFLLPLAFS